MNSHDPHMPLAAGRYHYQATPESRWILVDSDRLAVMLNSGKPPVLRNVLAITAGDVEQPATLKYAGPFYADFDAESIDEAIAAVRKFLAKLEALGLELETVRLFATGKKGFHLEVPSTCFAELPPDGLPLLPKIYGAMGDELHVDCLDRRVFSCGKGRMWRCPNIKRDNGKFKVPVTTAEIEVMTAEMYTELTSAPRPFPPLATPEWVPELAELFDRCRAKVEASAARRVSAPRVDTAFQKRFGGKLPPVLAALGQGRFPSPVGWNLIVIQLGLAAHAVGMDEDALVSACRGLIANHESDGGRYNTPHKREAEMRRMYDYLPNSNYQLSVGGLRSILPKGLRCNDFKGL